MGNGAALHVSDVAHAKEVKENAPFWELAVYQLEWADTLHAHADREVGGALCCLVHGPEPE